MIGAFVVDPTRTLPILQRMVGAAEVSAQAQRSGYGQLTQQEGELYSGVDAQAAAQGFGQLVDLQQVLGQLPGETGQAYGRDQALSAVFQGNETAKNEIEARAKRRLATFQQGGQFSTSEQGISGVGSG